MEITKLPMVDPRALWASLPPDAQADFGVLAIAAHLAVEGSLAEPSDEIYDHVRAFETADSEIQGAVTAFFDQYLPSAFSEEGSPLLPKLNLVGIRQCLSCGCTEDHACPGGCDWANATTCTACVAKAHAAA